MRTVVIGENLIGMQGGNGFSDGYNPFDLYGAAERIRGRPLPPHLVFAELDNDNPSDACAFLNGYGPLEGTNNVLALVDLKPWEQEDWKKLSPGSPNPEEHFGSMLGEVPLLPGAPVAQGDFSEYPIAQFWRHQSEFELALRLHSALDSPTDQLRKIRKTLNTRNLDWEIRGRNTERQYINRARAFVATTVNKHLNAMSPRLARVPNSNRLCGVWGCYTLLQAMYLMLFLDIAGWSGRIAQCEKCRLLFYTGLDRGKYCSFVCENRDRALRAYHKKKGNS